MSRHRARHSRRTHDRVVIGYSRRIDQEERPTPRERLQYSGYVVPPPHPMRQNAWVKAASNTQSVQLTHPKHDGQNPRPLLAIDPTGGLVSTPTEMLAGSPFRDFRIPGMILLIGLGELLIAAALHRVPAWAFANTLNPSTLAGRGKLGLNDCGRGRTSRCGSRRTTGRRPVPVLSQAGQAIKSCTIGKVP
jgi:hypothetical protein